MTKKNYLITGSRGFIGRNLIKYIKKKEPNSKIIEISKKINLEDFKQTINFFKKLNKIDYIFHLADVSGNKNWTIKNNFNQTQANLKIHLNVISAWKTYKPNSKFVFFSSLWAYPVGKKFQSEKNYWKGDLIEYSKFYAYTKKIASTLLIAAKQNFNLKSTTFVLGTVFGPDDKSDHFIPTIIRKIKKKPKKIIINGSGKESRDFIFVNDQIKAIFKLKNTNEYILNIGSCDLISIKIIVTKLKKIMNFNGKILFKKKINIEKDVYRGMKISKAKKLGWYGDTKLTDLDEALKITVKGFDKT